MLLQPRHRRPIDQTDTRCIQTLIPCSSAVWERLSETLSDGSQTPPETEASKQAGRHTPVRRVGHLAPWRRFKHPAVWRALHSAASQMTDTLRQRRDAAARIRPSNV